MTYDQATYMREWRARNRERIIGYCQKWRENNKAHVQAYDKLRGSTPRKRAQRAERYRRDPERSRLHQFKQRYGYTHEDVARFDAAANCGLCKQHVGVREPGKRHKLHVDHCHATGKIRGFLCNKYNTGLGKLGDTIEALKRALEYLRAND